MASKIRWLSVIRCVGIILIVIYHFFRDYLPGGFIGVDVFLTLSGFLITAQIIKKSRKSSGFEFDGFIKRRFSRIYPLFFIMVIFSLSMVLLISPDFSVSISKQTAAALSFVTNYYEIQRGGSYEAQLLPHIFVHTWFLAVEMHIYIVWGLALAAITRYAKKHRLNSRRIIFILSAAVAVLSYIHMQSLFNADPSNPSVAYFGSTSRAFPFFIGAMTGALTDTRVDDDLIASLKSRFRRCLIICAAIGVCAGLVAISLSVDFSGAAAYRWGMLAASLLTAALIRLLWRVHAFTPEHIKEPALLSFFSEMTYGVYLFHWPLFIVFSNIPLIPGKAVAAAAAIVISLLMSVIVAYWLQPVLLSRKRLSVKAVPVIIIACLMVLSGFTFHRAPAISSIERSMYIAYLQQDSDMLYGYESIIGSSPLPSSAESNREGREGIESGSGNIGHDLISSTGQFSPYGGTAASVASIAGARLPWQDPAADSFWTPALIGSAQSDLAPGSPDQAGLNDISSENTSMENSSAQQDSGVPYGSNPFDFSPEYYMMLQGGAVPDRGGIEGILVLGDSVLLGARTALLDAVPGIAVDAEGSRQMWQGYEYIMELQEEGALQEYVVIALGTNGNENSFEYVDKIIADINPGHRLIFVAPYNGQGGERSVTYRTAVYIRGMPELYDFVTVADWSALILPDPEIIGFDRIHIGGNDTAIELFVNCIIDALQIAGTKPAKQ